MTEIEAAIAQEQFRKMPNMNNQRIILANRLTEGLRLIDGLEPPAQEPGCRHVYYLYPILFDEEKVGMPRDLFAKAIVAEGFYLRPGYLRPVYLEPVYQRKLCFGYNGFPFSANPRNAELNYSAGICPTVERLQKDSVMVTTIMQPPQTLTDMDNFIEACKKTIHNREKLLAAWNRQTI
jgi:dTDP-4-amino-4,6-dideoxygalactose transaminase